MKNFGNKAFRLPILSFLFLPLFFTVACQDESKLLACLPESKKLTDVVSIGGIFNTKVTISDKLRELGARCENNLLVDSKGKEIRFHHDYCAGVANEEIINQIRKQYEDWQKKYNVIVMACNPGGEPYP